MADRTFYAVPPEARLFGMVHSGPEEEVRQWCLAELMTRHGVRIDEIRVEWPVRVGSKQFRADIVVMKEDKPYVVIECKKRDHNHHQHAVEQAISYADSAETKAEFAVYTNGTVWAVRRRAGNGWAEVPDLPLAAGRQSPLDVHRPMVLIRDLWPILHKLGEPVGVEEARKYLSAWQRFFYGGNIATPVNAWDLVHAADNLFRVASCLDQRDGYLYEKAAAACKHLGQFAKDRQLRFNAAGIVSEVPLYELARTAEIDLLSMTEACDGLSHPDIALLRFMAIVLRHIQECLAVKPGFRRPDLRVPVPQVLQDEARSYLACVLKLGLDWTLPDALDDISWGDIVTFTEDAWDHAPDQ